MTIKDIAKQCSVSVSTVSRVLNDRPDVSEDVRRKVLSAIKNSNYIPNNSARDLVRAEMAPPAYKAPAAPTPAPNPEPTGFLAMLLAALRGLFGPKKGA